MFVAGGCECACKSREGCAWAWVSLGKYGQVWAKVGYVRLIRHGWLTYLEGVCGCVLASLGVGVGGCGQVWTCMSKGGQRWEGLNGSDSFGEDECFF